MSNASRAARRYDPEQRRRQPSRAKRSTGYRHDAARHAEAREKVDPDRRAEIAAMGGAARAALFRPTRPAAPTLTARQLAQQQRRQREAAATAAMTPRQLAQRRRRQRERSSKR